MSKKVTKRAVLAIVLATAICTGMLIGTTFAWFTDSVTSTGNIIRTGTLQVGMSWADGDEDPATTTAWHDAEAAGADPVFYYEKWEPGFTQVRHIRVENKGSLALKYNLTFLPQGAADVNADLAGVIEVYYHNPAVAVSARGDVSTTLTRIGTLREVIDDTTLIASRTEGHLSAGDSEAVITLALHMDERAGNLYQDRQVNAGFDVVLYATQYTEEEDTFDHQYDKLATYESAHVGRDLTLQDGAVQVTVPAAAAQINDVFELSAGALSLSTDAGGKTTASVGISLTRNGQPLDSPDPTDDTIAYQVAVDIGKNLNVTDVLHNGVSLGAGGFTYDADTGIVTFTVTSFSQFAIVYNAPVSVTFNGGGADGGAMDAQNVYAGVETALTANAYTKTGHSFAGWATADGGTAVYADGAAITVTESTTLYAVWQVIRPNGITLSKTSETIKENETLRLTATVSPDTALDTGVIWTSGDTDVAEVDADGLVTAKKAGTAVITAACSGDTSVYAVCALTVEASTVDITFMEYNASTNTFTQTTQAVPAANKVTAATTQLTGGWYYAEGTVSVSSRLQVTGTVSLILCDNASMTASSGIEVNGNNTLQIYAQKGDNGQLAAFGGSGAAGIGGGQDQSCGTVIINGGSIIAKGGFGAAGIGSGLADKVAGLVGGEVTVNGGDVRATGGSGAAGIGGGSNGDGGTLTVNGGIVTATGGRDAAGIGGGIHGIGGTLTVNGGIVTANSGIGGGAGIGGGSNGIGGIVTVTGGNVTASGGIGAAGIGGGTHGSGGAVAITGGRVTASGGSGAAGIGGGVSSTVHGILTVSGFLEVCGGNSANPTDRMIDYATNRPRYMIIR